MAKENGTKMITAFRVIWPILLLIGGFLILWATTCFKVNNLCEAEVPALKQIDKELQSEIDKHTVECNTKFDRQESQIHMQNEAIIKLQGDVTRIDDTTNKIYIQQREILQELRSR